MIRHLEALLKLIHTLATGKSGPKVRSKRKKAVKNRPLAKKRAALVGCLINTPPAIQRSRRGKIGIKRLTNKMCMSQIFGISSETESSWPDALSEAHRDFILAYIEMEQAREEAVVRQFLAARDRERLDHSSSSNVRLPPTSNPWRRGRFNATILHC